MAYRRPARWFAPVALLGAIGAILLTISSTHSGATSSTGGSAAPAASTGARHTSTGTGTLHTRTSRYYVVRSGDVLSGIAAATNVPLSRIEHLNPGVDAQSLHAGQKIKLVP